MTNNVKISKRGVERARNGHLWIYRSDVVETTGVEAGDVVRLVDDRGKFVGKALYSDRSEITLRLLSSTDEEIDREWWRERIRAAIRRRAGIDKDANAYRLVYSEGDLLSSLIVDRYDDVLVVQTLSQGTDRLKNEITSILVEELSPRAVIERNDVKVRQLEGLELQTGSLFGDAPGELEINQHGVRFVVSPLAGQKTGSFLDQRENHLAARDYSRGRALDCFTFNGGFALHMAARSESVIGLDVSADAVVSARRNAELNQIANVEFREANVFDALREMESSGERFDTIVLDPPAFAKNRASLSAAMRGYKEINLRAIKLLRAEGILISCSCSYHMSENMFVDVVTEAAVDAGRRVQLVEKRMQSRDHPVLLSVPETHYLKCIVARVID